MPLGHLGDGPDEYELQPGDNEGGIRGGRSCKVVRREHTALKERGRNAATQLKLMTDMALCFICCVKNFKLKTFKTKTYRKLVILVILYTVLARVRGIVLVRRHGATITPSYIPVLNILN